jgi:hypothetical protein
MQAHNGNIARSSLKVTLKGLPAREGAAVNRVPLHIAEPFSI